ncbi:MAG: hypothetical protein IPL69_19515 [Saprospiraceae bacterium]|nr:hypothetical protein [Candidatus Brachybacter algidus]
MDLAEYLKSILISLSAGTCTKVQRLVTNVAGPKPAGRESEVSETEMWEVGLWNPVNQE